MSSSFHAVLISCCILATYSLYTIDCKTQDCRHNYIDCLPNEDCFVSCDKTESCKGGIINCPIEGDCSILCKGGGSCRDMIINATLSNGNFNLQCQESTDHCKGIKIYGSKLQQTNIGNYTIICNGNQRSCANSYIECPSNSNCNIICSSDTSCRWSEIIGPTNGNLNIECNGINSCFDAAFDASNSQLLNINGCIADKSCLDLTLYCPPNTNGHKNCFIEGNNNIGRDNAKGINIYAINGWNDIDINYYGTYTSAHSGTMHCGNNYDIQCDIAKDDWSCSNENDFCNFYTYNKKKVNKQINTTRNPCNKSHYHEDDEIDCYNLDESLDDIIDTTTTIAPKPTANLTTNTNSTTVYEIVRPLFTTESIIKQPQHENNESSFSAFSHTVFWTTEIIIGLVLVVVAFMLFVLGIYCCCTTHAPTGIKKVNENDKILKSATISDNRSMVTMSKYKCIDIINDENDLNICEEDELKKAVVEDIRNTIKAIHEGGIFEQHVNNIGSSMSNDMLNSDANSGDMETKMENKVQSKKESSPTKMENVISPNTYTISGNTGHASSNDIHERNILFLNPPLDTLHVNLDNNRKTTQSGSSETSVSIQTNYNETSVSFDMYASPITPSNVLVIID